MSLGRTALAHAATLSNGVMQLPSPGLLQQRKHIVLRYRLRRVGDHVIRQSGAGDVGKLVIPHPHITQTLWQRQPTDELSHGVRSRRVAA